MDSDEFKDHVNGLLSQGVVEVEFTKKDGTSRKMVCSTSLGVIPPDAFPEREIGKYEGMNESTLYNKSTEVKPQRIKAKREPNPDVCVVWDFEKTAWRSFRYDSVNRIQSKETP